MDLDLELAIEQVGMLLGKKLLLYRLLLVLVLVLDQRQLVMRHLLEMVPPLPLLLVVLLLPPLPMMLLVLVLVLGQ